MRNVTIKSYILSLLFVLSLAAIGNVNANVVCKKDGRFWYPANEVSTKIAAALGVKTCNGKRFKAVVAKLGMSSNVKKAKGSKSVADVIKMFK